MPVDCDVLVVSVVVESPVNVVGSVDCVTVVPEAVVVFEGPSVVVCGTVELK